MEEARQSGFRFSFGFDVDEVYVRRDAKTGDVILSKRPTGWGEFLAIARKLCPSDVAGFMEDRRDPPTQERDLF